MAWSKEKRAAYARDTRHWYKEHHMCIDCGKQDAYTLSGKSRCYECGERANECSRNNYDSKKPHERYLKRKQQAIENGLCTCCFKRKADTGYKSCSICRKKDIEKYRKKQCGTIKRSERKTYGICYRCGNNLDGQLKVNGTKSNLCSCCYSKQYIPVHNKILYTPFSNSPQAIENFNRLKEKYIKEYDKVTIIRG